MRQFLLDAAFHSPLVADPIKPLRWNRRIAVSMDHRVVELGSEGRAVDITNALTMANSTGFDAAEANEAVTFTCSQCNGSGLGHSKFIVMSVEPTLEHGCRSCYSDSVKDDPFDLRASRGTKWTGKDHEDEELSTNQWKKDRSEHEGKPRNSVKATKANALAITCARAYGSVTKESKQKMQKELSKGIGTEAWVLYTKVVMDIANKDDVSAILRDLSATADFMPMISETVSYRYSCRRSGCRKIPLKETQWLIAAAMLGAGVTMWFCPACGGQYTHALKDAGEDRGQDLQFNYVIFMQIELGDGIQKMCAFAAAPNDHINNLLITRKLILWATTSIRSTRAPKQDSLT